MEEIKKNLNIKEIISKRNEHNQEILKLLSYFSNENPQLRFWQILNLIFKDLTIDRFYEESCTSLDTIKTFLKNRKV